MSEPVRRSSRRQTKKNHFKVGDIVEVTKVGMIVRGRLVAQVDSTQSNQPRWQIAYEDDTHPEEELFESALGQIVSSTSSDTDQSSPTQPPPPPPPPVDSTALAPTPSPASVAAAATARKKNRKNGRFVKSNENGGVGGGGGGSTLDKKVSFSNHEASDSSVVSNGKRTSREKRTARRHRHLPDGSLDSSGPLPPKAHHKKRPPAHSTSGAKSSKKSKQNHDEEVVKVPMLTGTLYLYRGVRRRAEFHRRV